MLFNTLNVRNIILFFTLIGFPACHAVAWNNSTVPSAPHHVFSAGDVVYVSVLDEEMLTGSYTIDDSGVILMPLLGKVQISNLTAMEAEELLTVSLQDGYILKPVVSVRSEQKDGFYILGEVKNPGYYAMPDKNINVLNAVAVAGGFTWLANEEAFDIIRNQGGGEQYAKNNAMYSKLLSGDIVIVKRRFF